MSAWSILFIFFCFTSVVNAQNIDSVRQVVANQPHDGQKAATWLHFGQQQLTAGQNQPAINSFKESLRLAEVVGDENLILTLHLQLAKSYYERGDEQNALIHFRLYSILSNRHYETLISSEVSRLDNLHQLEVKALEEQRDNALSDLAAASSRANALRAYRVLFYLALALTLGGGLYLFRRLRNPDTIADSMDAEKDGPPEEISTEISELKLKLGNSIDLANKAQAGLLPLEKDFKKLLPDSFILDKPKRSAGGDFLWFGEAEGKIMLAVADCSANDVSGVLISVVINKFLNQIIVEGQITAPNMALSLLDQNLRQKVNPDGDWRFYGVKIAICAIDTDKGEIEYGGAKLPIYYADNGGLKRLDGNRFAAGSPHIQEKFYHSETLTLSKGGMLYLATDGFANQFGGKQDKKFMRTAFEKLLGSVQNQKVSEQFFVLDKVIDDWKGRKEQTDDILVAGIKL